MTRMNLKMHYKQKSSDTKNYVLYDSLYMKL